MSVVDIQATSSIAFLDPWSSRKRVKHAFKKHVLQQTPVSARGAGLCPNAVSRISV